MECWNMRTGTLVDQMSTQSLKTFQSKNIDSSCKALKAHREMEVAREQLIHLNCINLHTNKNNSWVHQPAAHSHLQCVSDRLFPASSRHHLGITTKYIWKKQNTPYIIRSTL